MIQIARATWTDFEDTVLEIGEGLREQWWNGTVHVVHHRGVLFVLPSLSCVRRKAKQDKTAPVLEPKFEPFAGQGFRLGGSAYNGEVRGDEIYLSSDQVLLFLYDNGINVNPVTHLTSALGSRLGETMRMIGCDVQAQGLTLCLRLRFDYDFQTYLANPKAFEDFFKDEVLLALGLDPVALPNAKKMITIEQAMAGSIFVQAIIFVSVVSLSVFLGWCFQKFSKRGSVPPPPPPPAPPAQRAPGPPPRAEVGLRVRIPAGGADTQGTHAGAAGIAGGIGARARGNEGVSHSSATNPRSGGTSSSGEASSTSTSGSAVAAANGNAGSSHSSDAPWLSQLSPAQLASSSPAQRMQLLDGPHRQVKEVRWLNASDGSCGVILRTVASQDNRCFMLKSLFQMASCYEHKEAAGLKVGDQVLSPTGNILLVAFVERHPRVRRRLVTLRTAQAEITVTDDHRVVILCPNGSDGEAPAGALHKGDMVRCGKHLAPLTLVRPFEAAVEVVEIRFDPDDPVETRLLPSWSIWTKGAERHWTMGWGSQGPSFFGALGQDGTNHGGTARRSRSL